MKYFVIDWYDDDDGEFLYYGDSKEKAFAIAKEREYDTEFDCDVQIYSDYYDYDLFKLFEDRIKEGFLNG